MKTPICKICVSSDIMCSGCQAKLDKGEVSQHAVEVARALSKLSERFSALDKTEFKKAIGFEDLTIIMVPKGTAGQFIGRGGVFIKDINNHPTRSTQNWPCNGPANASLQYPLKFTLFL